MPTEGIRAVAPTDHRFAERFGLHHQAPRHRLRSGDAIELRVHPALVVRRDSPLANINGVLNAVALEGRALGPCLLSGRGAGAMATAVSVVADVLDVARARLAQRLRRYRHARSIQMEVSPCHNSDGQTSERATTCVSKFTIGPVSSLCSRERSARRECRSSKWCRKAARDRADWPCGHRDC